MDSVPPGYRPRRLWVDTSAIDISNTLPDGVKRQRTGGLTASPPSTPPPPPPPRSPLGSPPDCLDSGDDSDGVVIATERFERREYTQQPGSFIQAVLFKARALVRRPAQGEGAPRVREQV